LRQGILPVCFVIPLDPAAWKVRFSVTTMLSLVRCVVGSAFRSCCLRPRENACCVSRSEESARSAGRCSPRPRICGILPIVGPNIHHDKEDAPQRFHVLRHGRGTVSHGDYSYLSVERMEQGNGELGLSAGVQSRPGFPRTSALTRIAAEHRGISQGCALSDFTGAGAWGSQSPLRHEVSRERR